MNLQKKGTAKIYLLYVVTVLLWYNLLEMNTANKGKYLVINYNTYFISSNIIFISKSSSEWVSELRLNVPPTTRSYGNVTSLIIIYLFFFFFICLKLFLLWLSLSLKKTRKCVYETLCPQPYACPEKRFKSERSATQTIKKLISSSTP